MRGSEAQFIKENIDIFCCPGCKGELVIDGDDMQCDQCKYRYPSTDNIPQLFWPNDWGPDKGDITQQMKSFYEETPFPNYDDFDSAGSLVEKARRRIFAKLLDDQIPFGSRVIECGCGTGQLTNFLSIANRTVIGADLCLNSLKLAQGFKERNELRRASFFQMNLFRPCFKPHSFDLVISNGVLHHTSDPYLAFKSIATLVKPKGYILIGLYHKYGRLTTDLRRFIFRVTGDRFKFFDRSLAKKGNVGREQAWFKDQYKNPHESKHTVEEVLGWLKDTGFDFVKSIPTAKLFKGPSESNKLFKPEAPSARWERVIAEIAMMGTASRDGGLFIVIGRKP